MHRWASAPRHSVHIEDIERVSLVVRGGRIYDRAHIEQALGIAPRTGG